MEADKSLGINENRIAVTNILQKNKNTLHTVAIMFPYQLILTSNGYCIEQWLKSSNIKDTIILVIFHNYILMHISISS